MIYILYFLHVLVSIFLIAVVLLQSGKGADLSVFGGGGTQAAFGARGGANILHKLTVAGFVLFIVTTLGIGLMQSRRGSSSLMSGAEVPATEEASDVPAPTGAEKPSEDSSATPEAASPAASAPESGTSAGGSEPTAEQAAPASASTPPEASEQPEN